MKKTLKEVNSIVEDALQEYFAIAGPSLPTAGSVSHQDVGPFHQYITSTIATLDRILDIVNNDVTELDKIDAQEFLYQSVPKLESKIKTITDAIERKTGLKAKEKDTPSPLIAPKERKAKKIKLK